MGCLRGRHSGWPIRRGSSRAHDERLFGPRPEAPPRGQAPGGVHGQAGGQAAQRAAHQADRQTGEQVSEPAAYQADKHPGGQADEEAVGQVDGQGYRQPNVLSDYGAAASNALYRAHGGGGGYVRCCGTSNVGRLATEDKEKTRNWVATYATGITVLQCAALWLLPSRGVLPTTGHAIVHPGRAGPAVF